MTLLINRAKKQWGLGGLSQTIKGELLQPKEKKPKVSRPTTKELEISKPLKVSRPTTKELKISQPKKKQLEKATTEQICQMIRDYRDTKYHNDFLRLLLNLPESVWTKNNLDEVYIQKALNDKELDKLHEFHVNAADPIHTPLTPYILHRKKKAP